MTEVSQKAVINLCYQLSVHISNERTQGNEASSSCCTSSSSNQATQLLLALKFLCGVLSKKYDFPLYATLQLSLCLYRYIDFSVRQYCHQSEQCGKGPELKLDIPSLVDHLSYCKHYCSYILFSGAVMLVPPSLDIHSLHDYMCVQLCGHVYYKCVSH